MSETVKQAADRLAGIVMALAHPADFNAPTRAEMLAALDAYDAAQQASASAKREEGPTCTRCGRPIEDGYMIGDGDGTGRRFAHPECYRHFPGAHLYRAIL